MESKSDSEWLKSFGGIFQELTSHGFKPKLQTALKVTSQKMRNAAECVIRTFKEHSMAGSSVDPYFPMHLWDRLLPQAEMTLNLLRTSILYPQLSAAAHFHGLIDYTKTAFSPPGYNIIAHEKPPQRRTWAPRGQPGYSLSSSMHHYRCQSVYITYESGLIYKPT
jgi:hypothetical protein